MRFTLPKKRILSTPLIVLLLCVFLFNICMQQQSAAVSSSFVTANGKKLYLHDQEYQFVGVNAFNLATFPGSNAGCGGYVSDIDSFFSSLRPNAMVRLWAFQGTMGTNVSTKQVDWTGIDRVVNAAQKNGKKLILVLTEQAGQCDDGHWKDLAWYNGGYKQAFNETGNGLTPLPYLDYVKQIVARYKDSPAVAMWEPINEPVAANCTNGKGYQCFSNLTCGNETANAQALRSFFDNVGGTIKSIDPNHLISSGANGDGQCGTVYENYQYVHASSGIDVGSFHDYYRDDQAMPGDQWNGLSKRITQMGNLNKPLIIGEVGMLASSNGAGCISLTTRRDKIKAKMDAQFKAGVAGYLPWSLTMSTTASGCNYDIGAYDPILTLFRDYPVSMSTIAPTTAVINFPTPTPVSIDRTPPTAPTVTVSGITTNQVTLNWSGATDNVQVERYDIFKDWSYVTSTTGTSFTHTGLTPDTSYLYYVKAKDSSGNYSDLSNRVTIKTLFNGPTPTPTKIPTSTPTIAPDTTPPSVATNLTATATSTQVTLNWTPATDNVKVDRYEVYRDYQYVTAVWGTTFTHTNLTPGKTYTYYLKTRDAAGNSSGTSSIIKVTTLP